MYVFTFLLYMNYLWKIYYNNVLFVSVFVLGYEVLLVEFSVGVSAVFLQLRTRDIGCVAVVDVQIDSA